MKGRCGVCLKEAPLEWITVRVYCRRKQYDFRYHVCADDKQVLLTFLEGGAEAVSLGLFDHRNGEVIKRTQRAR